MGDSQRAQASDNGRPVGGGLRGPNREGLRVAVVCEDYPESQISKENYTDIYRAIGWLVDELPEEGLTPRLVDS